MLIPPNVTFIGKNSTSRYDVTLSLSKTNTRADITRFSRVDIRHAHFPITIEKNNIQLYFVTVRSNFENGDEFSSNNSLREK